VLRKTNSLSFAREVISDMDMWKKCCIVTGLVCMIALAMSGELPLKAWQGNSSTSVNVKQKVASRNNAELKTLAFKTDLVPGTVDVAVLIPPAYNPKSKPLKLLLWLHGGPGDSSYLEKELSPVIQSAWQRGILEPLIVAVPSARRSFYMDYRDGSEKWESFILQELIPTLRKKYHLPDDRRSLLIGGYSMGGMGSLRMAFKKPDLFSVVTSLAPAIEPAYRFQDIEPRDREFRTQEIFERTYGKPIDDEFWQANHPPTIVKDHADSIRKSGLKIYFEVGNADELGLYRGAEFLHDTLAREEIAHEYRVVDGAKHQDGTLPARLEDAVRFISRKLREAGNP